MPIHVAQADQFARNRIIVRIHIQIKGTFSSSQLGGIWLQSTCMHGIIMRRFLCFHMDLCFSNCQSILDQLHRTHAPTVAFMCVHHSTSSRPCMKSVIRFLKVDSHLNRCEDLNSQSSTCSTRDSEDWNGLAHSSYLNDVECGTCRLPWSGEI